MEFERKFNNIMNKYKFEQNCIYKDILEEGINEAVAKWWNTQEINEYIELFMNKKWY